MPVEKDQGGDYVERVAQAEAIDILQFLHAKLDLHFRTLNESRRALDLASPVFALEHGLDTDDLALLKDTVREAVRTGFKVRSRQWWLPFVAYAAEVGYAYVGDEYWHTFAATTPGWGDYDGDRRHIIKTFFVRFADQYGGARPTGAWAQHFRIICWPITHAVLPSYLQRHLAHLLFEYRRGLTTDLLDDPAALGIRLEPRSVGYTDRFRIFCQNTSLLGHVAAALLSGDDETPYLLGSTLHRIIEGLSAEAQSRRWLHDAKRYANQVRSTGLRPAAGVVSSRANGIHLRKAERLPAATDPVLQLRRGPDGWRAYAVLPDLSPLQSRLPHVYNELRTLRAFVSGAEDSVLGRGRLTYPGQEVRLSSWPASDRPFVQLERGSADINTLLANQSIMTVGPWWLFRLRGNGAAVQVKGKFVLPGHSYCLVGRPATEPPTVTWIQDDSLLAIGARAYRLTVPEAVLDGDVAALNAAGLALMAGVKVRPVGLVASGWDGEGAVEWLSGDPAMIAIRGERPPSQCILSIDGRPHLLTWPAGHAELYLALDRLGIGTHEVTVTLLKSEGGSTLARGTLLVTVRDAQTRPPEATRGEGIMMLAAPARPWLNDLWDGRADVTILGPPGTRATLTATLRGPDGARLESIHREVGLPMSTGEWRQFARDLRGSTLQHVYDVAESCDLTVSRAGVGFASITCERGFQPIRWVLRRKGRQRTARLIDRTDGGVTNVSYYTVEAPTVAVDRAADSEECPPCGGLIRAMSRDAVAAMVLPPDPNGLRLRGVVRPSVPVGLRTVDEVSRLITFHDYWSTAELPADPFARRDQSVVEQAITAAVVSLVSGPKWARLEESLDHNSLLGSLDDMRSLVGEAQPQRTAAAAIGRRLWHWASEHSRFEQEFREATSNLAASAGLKDRSDAAEFILSLAYKPGRVLKWPAVDRAWLIDSVIKSPVLLRAARFAVLGVEAMAEEVEKKSAGGARQ